MRREVPWWIRLLKDLGYEIRQDSKMLDFGCGAGNTVMQLIHHGFDAEGVDFKFKSGEYVALLEGKGLLSRIEKSPYRLPYADDSFDMVFSFQVMEHVMDYPQALAEIRRILRPGGVTFHMFPSRLRIIESHVRVPFSSVFRKYWYLRFWAQLGITATPSQTLLSPKERALENMEALDTNTMYHSGKKIKEFFIESGFTNFEYAERLFLKNSPNRRGKRLAKLGTFFPPVFLVYRVFWARVLVAS